MIAASALPANAGVSALSFDANGEASINFNSFKDTGLNTTSGIVTTLTNDYTFTLSNSEELLSAGLSGSSIEIASPVKYTYKVGSVTKTGTAPVLNSEIEGVFTLYEGSVGSGTPVPAVGSVVNSAAISGTTSGSQYSYSAGIGTFTLDPGSYYIQYTYAYNPDYYNSATGKYVSLIGGANLEGGVSVQAVPEASTWAMLGLGFAGLVLFGMRKGSAARFAL